MMSTPDEIETLASNNDLLEVGRLAIEDVLVEWRDARISKFTRGNGLVIKEANGDASHIIRLGPEDALAIGLKAIAEHLRNGGGR